ALVHARRGAPRAARRARARAGLGGDGVSRAVSPLPVEPRSAVSARALRVVLALALDREEVAACLGVDEAVGSGTWPSTLYAWAAEAAARSPRVWLRCARALDRALEPSLAPIRDASAA